MDTQHTPILKRAGAVLLFTGLVDIALVIYYIANHISYLSILHICDCHRE